MKKASRRDFLQAGAAVAALPRPKLAEANVYTRLGVRPVINGIGTVTVLGGSVMHPEVVRAMDEASRYFVNLPELQDKVGARVAELLGVPAAMVTAGAASAITVAAAACVAGGDRRKVRQLPDTTGLKNEIVQQKTHRSGYEAQMLLTGAKIVRIETREEAEQAINERTAMLFFLNKADPDGQIKRQEWIELGKKRGVPTFSDAAADVPPSSRLGQYVKEGFDLVTFSGGKGLFGPQCSGLLLGRKDLIEAGKAAISPSGGIGRGMKVGKEEMIGVLAAVERYLKADHDAERRELEDRATHVLAALAKVSGVKAEKHVPEIANNVPHVKIEWEGKRTAREVVKQLLEGEPSIAVSQRGERGLMVSMWTLRGDEHKTVARRLREVLT
jgi:D-glucosaminate-6-phosphate ammonia-lyase